MVKREMEDTEKKAQNLESQNDAVDSNLKSEATELNCLAASDGQESNMSLLKCENDVKAEAEGQSGANIPINGDNKEKEQKNDSTVDEQCNANVKTEDQSDSKGEALLKKESITDAVKDDSTSGNVQLPDNEVHKIDNGVVDEVHQSDKIIFEVSQNGNDMMVDEQKDPQIQTNPATVSSNDDTSSDVLLKAEIKASDTASEKMPEPATPKFLGKPSTAEAGRGEASTNIFKDAKMNDDEDEYDDGDDDGSPEDQAAFVRELERFYLDRGVEFKPLKFYGHPLNFLKLWRSVIRLGGYDRVTGSKLWRQVGESFNPPKTCTTISWTFRNFYEKALLEYERHKKQSGELQLPTAPPDSLCLDNEGNGHPASASGRAQRDAAARAMQTWHEHRRLGYSEDKNANNKPKHERSLKSTGSLKPKRENEVEHPVKLPRTETSKQLVTRVVDVGPPADWVKINVREARDCFEVYALVPGLLREEVRVQTDPAGRVVISGQPGQLDNPWGVTAFKKDIHLPGRINPLQTSAVVSLHGRLFVRLPFAQ